MATPPKTDAPSGKPSPPPIEYRYMYEDDKSPSDQLYALLRAISRYVICNVGDKDVGQLTPKKLAAFYKAVGGDYDSLFVNMPHDSISYMWQVTGCQHTLQPTADDFARPSIPALTPRGFSRWESLEILLGPDEHVPFLQYAVKNWNLKHPETGQDFPPDLPKTVFPTGPDDEVDRWHKACADKLRKDASTSRDQKATGAGPNPDHEPKVAYSHVRKPFQTPFQGRPRPTDPTYFERPVPERPVAYNHVPGRHGRMPSRSSPERYQQERNAEEQARRRSFSDYKMSPQPEPSSHPHGSTHLDPNTKRPEPARRHSQPRHVSSDSSDEDPTPPRTKRRQDGSPSVASQSPSLKPQQAYRHHPDVRAEEPRRGAARSSSLREKVAEKVSNILPNGIVPDRPRNNSRPSYNESSRTRRNRDLPPSRLTRSFSDLDSEDSSGPENNAAEYERRRRAQNDRESRDRERLRERERGRPRDFDRERDDERRERQYIRRPDMERRTSSHPDMDRRRDHASFASREDRKRWERRSPPNERGTSPMTGVSGRRYPEPAYT
ncbi:hydroxyproline-rich glycoprotein DZ-HRGP [Dactylonectria estremocensis]|uniref:Hydroxyproline-rich glycoprotein DZ-HRGP n=1 Tax=Dactylonectria estremocensis TaxID=1079267 RepID=A0A9P9F7T6_9HYPO|nr:hydroxyproline-rich glycoprotein DZ-HRGP [Dactylonectria estremocensis]